MDRSCTYLGASIQSTGFCFACRRPARARIQEICRAPRRDRAKGTDRSCRFRNALARHICPVIFTHDRKFTMIRHGLFAVLISLTVTAGLVSGQSTATTPTLEAMLTSLPNAKPPVLDQRQALWLATMSLSCIDHTQAPPQTRGYV